MKLSVLLVSITMAIGLSASVDSRAVSAGTLTIVNRYDGGVYFITIERGSAGGPFRTGVSSRDQQVKEGGGNAAERRNGEEPFRLTEGKMYGTTLLIAEGGSKSYSLEPGSYYVTLNFHKSGKGRYTMTEHPILITSDQTRTLTITVDGKLSY